MVILKGAVLPKINPLPSDEGKQPQTNLIQLISANRISGSVPLLSGAGTRRAWSKRGLHLFIAPPAHLHQLLTGGRGTLLELLMVETEFFHRSLVKVPGVE